MASRKEQKERLRAERMQRESAQTSKERRRRMVQLGTGAVLLAAVVVAILIVISQSGGDGGDATIEGASAVESELKGIPQEGTVLGESGTDVTIVEFGDLQCPVCKEFSEQVSGDLISGPVSDGDAAYQFRQWPILGEDSVTAAKAALAAGEQGKYWNYVELFYDNQGTENSGYVDDDFLESIAKGAGVADIKQWNDDRGDAKWDDVLADNDAAAADEGFTGTPSVIVEGPNGSEVPASLDLDGIEDAINSVS